MAGKHLHTGRRLFRSIDAATRSPVLQIGHSRTSNTLEYAPSRLQLESSWRTRFMQSGEHISTPNSHGSRPNGSGTTALTGTGDFTKFRGFYATTEQGMLAAPRAEGETLLPARRQFSSKASGEPSEPRLAQNDPRNVPDRPAPPEASTFSSLSSLPILFSLWSADKNWGCFPVQSYLH